MLSLILLQNPKIKYIYTLRKWEITAKQYEWTIRVMIHWEKRKKKRETVKKGKEKNNAIKIQRLYSKVESHILSEK